MVKLVSTYLLQNNSVSIPGLGTIYVERIPAQSDFVNRQLLPPSYHYRFDRYFDAPGKEFFTYIAARKNIEDYEAIKLYNEWAMDLRNRISTEHAVVIEGIGELKRDQTGDILFETIKKPVTYFVPVKAERVVRTNARHAMLVGDKETTNVEMTDYLHEPLVRKRVSWWVFAIILAVIALALIIVNYSGGSPSYFGNRQKIQIK